MVFKELKEKLSKKEAVVCIVGLGYVGMELVKAFSKHLKVIGYDIVQNKINELIKNNNIDNIEYTTDQSRIREADFVLICVPTPVTKSKEPDLSYIISASKTVGKNLRKDLSTLS